MFRSAFVRTLVVGIMLALPIMVGAQAAPTVLVTRPDSDGPRPVAQAARRVGTVSIDGRLDESAWAAATPITSFRQAQPAQGRPATQHTEVRILYDDDAIYIGARMYDSLGAKGVHARLARRDALLNLDGSSSLTSDLLTVTLDTYHDHLTRAQFQINPLGVTGDALGEGGSSLDDSWDPVWEGAAHVDSLGWTAEMRIPLSQLGYAVRSDRTWGMQIVRFTDRLNEADAWAFWRSNESGGASRYGHLTRLDIPAPHRHLELLPYGVTRTRRAPVSRDNLLAQRTDETFRAGADLKAQVTSTLTLNATLNPDFGQTEVDPAVLNLSAFETFFPEKRPFFVQDASTFKFGGFSCFFCHNTSALDAFYSRRIGRAPELGDLVRGQAAFADVPDASTILGAGKLTGRLGTTNTVGVLDAVTGVQRAVYVDTVGSPRRTQIVEPLTNYLVARARRDFRGGASHAGLILTSVMRNTGDSLVASVLRSSATEAGTDLYTATRDRQYSLTGSLLITDVRGTPEAIARTEQSSAHYFQRPDRREHGGGVFGVPYDTTATTLRGYGAYLRGGKDSGNWLWEALANMRSPGFEVNDVSDEGRADYLWSAANVVRQWTTPGRWYRNLWLVAGAQQQYNYDGDRTQRELHGGFSATLPSYWSVEGYIYTDPPVLDDQLTRGGAVVTDPGLTMYKVDFNTDPRRAVVFKDTLRYYVGSGIGSGTTHWMFAPELLVKPSARLSVDFAPNLARGSTAQQYVTTIADSAATSFYGHRAVFATIQQTTLSFDTRVSMTFTPTLTLETYVQPFVASGAYSHFNEYAAPRTAQLVVYGRDAGSTIAPVRGADGAPATYTVDPDGTGPAASFTISNPDFTVRSLIGNAVLRWEYRPGSTLYLVWTHDRERDDALGRFAFARDLRELLASPPTNTVQLKVTYWLGR